MKDIARDLGVSVVTVSKVLRNHSDIGEETRKRVLKRIKELNYKPNLAARSLVTGRTYAVGLIVPELVHPFFAELAKGLSPVLRKKGYGLVIACSEGDPDLEQDEIDQLLARRVDALIIASTQQSPEFFKRIEEQGTPYVLVDRKFNGWDAHFVGIDDEAAGHIATKHLIEQGFKRIAHIGGQNVSTANGRVAGYRRALAEHSIEVPSQYVVRRKSGDHAGDVTGYESMQKLLQLTPPPDAVFCYNDPTATGALKAVLERGLRIPEDVALIGCGNTFYAHLLRVPLSSVSQDTESLGEKAGKLALSLVGTKSKIKPRTVLLEPKLVARESTGRSHRSENGGG
jgi:LacI family transcriptional regulator